MRGKYVHHTMCNELTREIHTLNEIEDVLTTLCDVIGVRPVGSEGERHAMDYLRQKMEDYGLTNVRTEGFSAPAWQRGPISAQVVSPVLRPLQLLALPATPSVSLEGEVVWAQFDTEDEFSRIAPKLNGKICLNLPTSDRGRRDASLHRSERIGLSMEAGACAFLWASPRPGQILATGSINPMIAQQMPAFAISYEDAHLLRRLDDRAGGEVRLSIDSTATIEEIQSKNIIGDVLAKDDSSPTILVTAHYDSHDITVGAFDNAAGCAVVLDCARVLARRAGELGCNLRFILFSGEELGLLGSKAYVRDHRNELGNIRIQLNADGLGVLPAPKYIHTPIDDRIVSYLQQLYQRVGHEVQIERVLALNWDHAPFALEGVPVASITDSRTAGTVVHAAHTSADTVDKINVESLKAAASDLAVAACQISLDTDWDIGRLDQATIDTCLRQAGRQNQFSMAQSEDRG